MLLRLTVGNKYSKIWVAYNGIIFTPNFVPFCPLVQKFKGAQSMVMTQVQIFPEKLKSRL